MLLERGEVVRGAVAFVAGEVVFGKTRVHFNHQTIPRDLRDDARSGDAEAETVSSDECGLRDGEGLHRASVDEHVQRLWAQQCDGAAHRLVRGAEDIDAVDFLAPDNRMRPVDVLPGRDFREQRLAGAFAQLLRVIERSVMKIQGQDDCG